LEGETEEEGTPHIRIIEGKKNEGEKTEANWCPGAGVHKKELARRGKEKRLGKRRVLPGEAITTRWRRETLELSKKPAKAHRSCQLTATQKGFRGKCDVLTD